MKTELQNISAQEVSDGYEMLMRKAESSGGIIPLVGQFPSSVILPCLTEGEIELAIAICEHWIAGRKNIRWIAMPPDTGKLPIVYGYVGCCLDDAIDQPISTGQVRCWMNLTPPPSLPAP